MQALAGTRTYGDLDNNDKRGANRKQAKDDT